MFKWFTRFFQPERKVTTQTTTTIDSAACVNPTGGVTSEVDLIIQKAKRQERVTPRETNLLLAERLDVKSLESTIFKLQDNLVKNALFNIESVTVIVDKDETVTDVSFKLSEICYGLNMEVTISAKDFHDTFDPFHLDPELDKGVYHDIKG